MHSKQYQAYFDLTRYCPRTELVNIVEHYWCVQWDLPEGEHYQQSVIPHPNTHLVFLAGKSHIQGICKQRYKHQLSGKGYIMGVKFKPAGFYPFANNVSLTLDDLCNKVIAIQDVFCIHTQVAEQQVLSLNTPEQQIACIDDMLFPYLHYKDENISFLNELVADIATNQSTLKVAQVVEKYNIPPRTLQRLFTKYIGVSVKWVINRYRIHDALTAIDNRETIDWAELALELGYYDQAHFISDFKALVGQPPKAYQDAAKGA